MNISLPSYLTTPFLKLGESSVSISSLLAATFIIVLAFLISGLLQRVLNDRLASRMGMVPGVTYAIKRVLHYVVLFIGFAVAFQAVGLNLTSLAVVLGFLSVGIGFGLQNVTSNFISGLIILLERPISVGDFVTVGDQSGTVTSINMRSTVISTRDNVSIIVPNSRFVSETVTNWSHGDPRVRLHAPVGVAYGSDEKLVVEALTTVAKDHPDVLATPAPEVRFLQFGDSSLNFDLLIWTNKPERQFLIRSQINFMIYKKLREVGLKIPFPQRDIHVQMTPAMESLAESKKDSHPGGSRDPGG